MDGGPDCLIRSFVLVSTSPPEPLQGPREATKPPYQTISSMHPFGPLRAEERRERERLRKVLSEPF